MDNRRKSPRSSIITMAHISPHGLQISAEALFINVSTGGVGALYAKGRYQKGEIIIIKASFRIGEGETIKESLMGRVAWAESLSKGKESAIGIQIPDMERKHPKLRAYIKHLERLV